MLSRGAAAARGFFFAAPGTPSDDALVTSVRRDAAATRRFVASVGAFGVYMGALQCLVCLAFLASHWGACGAFDRPLHCWLLVFASLQAALLPARAVLVVGLQTAAASGRSVEAFLTSLTASSAWRASSIVGRLLYAWLVLGTLWWMNSESCPSCPGIHRLIAAVLLTMALRTAVVLAASLLLAPGRQERRGRARSEALPEDEFPAVVSATSCQIEALPCVKFGACNTRSGFCTSCSICLADFEDGETLKKLPCGHLFHEGCVGAWLQRNKRCPLCVRAIDDH